MILTSNDSESSSVNDEVIILGGFLTSPYFCIFFKASNHSLFCSLNLISFNFSALNASFTYFVEATAVSISLIFFRISLWFSLSSS